MLQKLGTQRLNIGHINNNNSFGPKGVPKYIIISNIEKNQFCKDGWLRIEKDIKVMDLVLDKLLPLHSFQQTSSILFSILNNDQEFNKLIDLQSPFYDKMQLDLAESKNRLGFYTNRLEFSRPDIPQFKELPIQSVIAAQKRKSIWNELDLSLMLADDPDSEFQRLQEEGNSELKLPVRMTITEFTALVEIVRMHKKKFKAYEKKSHKRQQASNSATGTRKTSVKQAESSQQRRDTVIIDIKQSRKNSDIKKRLPTKTPRQTANPELQAIRQGLNQSINEKDESEEQDSDKSAFQQELFERNLGQHDDENRERKVSINKKRKPSSFRTGIEKKSRKQTDAFVIQEVDQEQNNAQEESQLREREDSSDTELPIQQSILNTKRASLRNNKRATFQARKMSQPEQKPPQSDLVEEEPTSSLMKINIPFPEEKGEVNLSDNYDSAKHIARGTSSIEDPSNQYDDESEGNSSSSSSFGAGVSESKLAKILKQYRDEWQREDQRMMTTVAQSIFNLKFKQNFERDVETLQMRMKELQEKISIADVVSNELETLHIEIKRAKFDKLDLNLEMSELQNRFNNVLGKVTEFEPEVQSMKNQVLMFKESLEIQNALDMQDHIDRERIALYGSIRNNESQPHFDGADDGNMMSQQKGVSIANGGVALNLINTCLSCSGQQHNQILQKAFKLACIYYKPSKVEYQGQKFDRHSLILQKSRLLDIEYKPKRKEDHSLLKQAEVLKDLLSSAQKRRTVLRSSLMHQSQTSLKNDQVLQERSMISERTGIDTQHIRFKSSERLLSAQSTDHYQTQSFRNIQISPVQKKETLIPEIISMKNFMQRTQKVPNLSKEISTHRIVLDDMNSRNEGQETLELPKVRKIVASKPQFTMLRTARAPTSHLQDMDFYLSQKQIQGPLPQVRPEISLSVIQRQKELISKRLVNMSALSSTRQKRLAQDSSYASIKDQLYNGTNVYMNPYASKQINVQISHEQIMFSKQG